MKRNWLPLLLLTFLFIHPQAGGQNASWVNPFIGTARSHAVTLWGNHGGTYPGAVAPWGRVQLTPETSTRPTESGYYYTDTLLRSFSCAYHHSGYPSGSAGAVHLFFLPGSHSLLPAAYPGRPFSHRQEEARPGYYSVTFPEGDRVETTARQRTGLFRYTTTENETTLILCKAGALAEAGDNTLTAAYLHTLIQSDQPWESCILRNDTAYLHFRKPADRPILQLLLKIGTSTNSFAGSRLNLEKEIPAWDFDAVQQAVYREWDEELACIEVQSADEANKQKFFTALYHSFLLPWILSDVDAEHDTYGGFSTWDTFRSLHPLLSLLKPDRQAAMLRSAMDEYRRKGQLPQGPMTAFHMIPVLTDAYLKGATGHTPGMDANALYQAMRACYTKENQQELLKEYREKGYIDASREQSVSLTAEYAYDDWALGHFARLTGRAENEAESFLCRSYNYRNLFDVQSLFLLPRDANGFVRNAGELGYQESNRWTASYFVPHNVKDLINLAGGDSAFIAHLQAGYRNGLLPHDNEPVFHYPYLFTWAGRPDLTAAEVRRILTGDYSTRPGGIPGNDDLGSTSSWFVLSAAGLYPACPGTGEYILTPPLFPQLRIHLQNGQTLTLVTRGKRDENPGYPSITLDGKAWNRTYIPHHRLAEGAMLEYDYTCPATHLATLERPYSETKESPTFVLTPSAPLHAGMHPDETNRIPFRLSNHGATGSCLVSLYDGAKRIASKRVLVEKGATVTDTLPFTLYKTGTHTLSLGNHRYTVRVKESVISKEPLICTALTIAPLLAVGEEATCTFVCKNHSGRTVQAPVSIHMDGEQVASHTVTLEAGADTLLKHTFTPTQTGFIELAVLNHHKRVKTYSHPFETCLLALDYTHDDPLCITDNSGFANHGRPHGHLQAGRQGKQGTLRIPRGAYVSFPHSESLQFTGTNQLTIAMWVLPKEHPRGSADFFTKGDYSLFKMEGDDRLVFFAGGWGRGECQTDVPADWYAVWHHIAGVCTGTSLRLYIDGKRVEEIEVDGKLAETELNWNLGRNAEMPYARYSDMQYGATRIYGAALTDEDVLNLYNEGCHDFKE